MLEYGNSHIFLFTFICVFSSCYEYLTSTATVKQQPHNSLVFAQVPGQAVQASWYKYHAKRQGKLYFVISENNPIKNRACPASRSC